MKKTSMWTWIGLAVILLLSFYYLLFVQSSSAEKSQFEIDLAGMRSLTQADFEKKSGPGALNSLLIGEGAFPSGAILAGDSLISKTRLVFTAFQVLYPDGKQLILDTAQDKSLYEEFYQGEPFYADNYASLQSSMNQASWIVATHEHVDHVGGIAQSENFAAIKDQVFLTKEQLNGPTIEAARFPAGNLEQLKPLNYDGLHLIAPGVVLQKAPGHSVGSQLIYVRRNDGQEFLFIGDIAWNLRNIEEQTGRPLLVSWIFLQEDREQVAHQLRALLELKQSHPELQVVIAHDGDILERIRKSYGVGSSFQ